MGEKAVIKMVKEINEKRNRPKLVITPAIRRDRETAQKAPINVMPKIPGAFVKRKKDRGRVYYSLVKSYRQGEEIYQVTLKYYGINLPRRIR